MSATPLSLRDSDSVLVAPVGVARGPCNRLKGRVARGGAGRWARVRGPVCCRERFPSTLPLA
jgi:hypothetical protein